MVVLWRRHESQHCLVGVDDWAYLPAIFQQDWVKKRIRELCCLLSLRLRWVQSCGFSRSPSWEGKAWGLFVSAAARCIESASLFAALVLRSASGKRLLLGIDSYHLLCRLGQTLSDLSQLLLQVVWSLNLVKHWCLPVVSGFIQLSVDGNNVLDVSIYCEAVLHVLQKYLTHALCN